MYNYIHIRILAIFHKYIAVPTMQKLGSYLEKVLDWEDFGYQLLPESKEYLVQV